MSDYELRRLRKEVKRLRRGVDQLVEVLKHKLR